MEMTIGNFIVNMYSTYSNFGEMYHMDFYTCDKIPIVKIPMNDEVYEGLLDNMQMLCNTPFGFTLPPHAPYRAYTIYMEYVEDEYEPTSGGIPTRYIKESDIAEPYLEDLDTYVHIMICEEIYPKEISKEVLSITCSLEDFYNVFGNLSELWMNMKR